MGAFQPLGSLIPALSYFCIQAASRVQCIAKQQINQHPTFFGSDSKVTSFVIVLFSGNMRALMTSGQYYITQKKNVLTAIFLSDLLSSNFTVFRQRLLNLIKI